MPKKAKSGGKRKGAGKKAGGRGDGGRAADASEADAPHPSTSHHAKGLRALGLRIKKVTPDGNCLFRALADQIHGERGPEGHGDIRRRVLDAIAANEDGFKWFLEDDEPFGDYVSRMRQDGEWGGQLELQVAANLYGVNITIHQEESTGAPAFMIQTATGKPTRTIHLHYDSLCEHYDSVRNNMDFEDGPAEEIVLLSKGGAMAAEKAAVEGRDPDWSSKVKVVVESVGCGEDEAAQHLGACAGDLDAALEAAIAAMHGMAPGDDGDGDGADDGADGGGGAEAKGDDVPALATEPGDLPGGSTDASAAPDPQGEGERGSKNAKWKKKPGRNKPCPCGSGLKYKACCKKKDAAVAGAGGNGAGEPELVQEEDARIGLTVIKI